MLLRLFLFFPLQTLIFSPSLSIPFPFLSPLLSFPPLHFQHFEYTSPFPPLHFSLPKYLPSHSSLLGNLRVDWLAESGGDSGLLNGLRHGGMAVASTSEILGRGAVL